LRDVWRWWTGEEQREVVEGFAREETSAQQPEVESQPEAVQVVEETWIDWPHVSSPWRATAREKKLKLKLDWVFWRGGARRSLEWCPEMGYPLVTHRDAIMMTSGKVRTLKVTRGRPSVPPRAPPGPRETKLWRRAYPMFQRFKRWAINRRTDRPRGKVAPAAIKYARIAKARFGTPDWGKPANRLAVRAQINQSMRNDGMREHDIAMHIDAAVALTFVPLEQEIAMAELASSPMVEELRSELAALGGLNETV
jgi:hypothetical protein